MPKIFICKEKKKTNGRGRTEKAIFISNTLFKSQRNHDYVTHCTILPNHWTSKQPQRSIWFFWAAQSRSRSNAWKILPRTGEWELYGSGCLWTWDKSERPLRKKYAHDCPRLDHPRPHDRTNQHLQRCRQWGLRSPPMQAEVLLRQLKVDSDKQKIALMCKIALTCKKAQTCKNSSHVQISQNLQKSSDVQTIVPAQISCTENSQQPSKIPITFAKNK